MLSVEVLQAAQQLVVLCQRWTERREQLQGELLQGGLLWSSSLVISQTVAMGWWEGLGESV